MDHPAPTDTDLAIEIAPKITEAADLALALGELLHEILEQTLTLMSPAGPAAPPPAGDPGTAGSAADLHKASSAPPSQLHASLTHLDLIRQIRGGLEQLWPSPTRRSAFLRGYLRPRGHGDTLSLARLDNATLAGLLDAVNTLRGVLRPDDTPAEEVPA